MAWLLAWLWQGLALTAGVALVLRLARPLGAVTRYALWWATLAAVVLLPAVGALARLGPTPLVASGPAVAAPAGALLSVALPAPADWAIAVVIGAWLGFLLLGLLQVARAVGHVRALKRAAAPIAAWRARRLRLWTQASAGGAGRTVTLCESDALAVPAALGLGGAMIVVPCAIVERLKDDELDQIVLHEYAHLQRRDDWTRLAQALVRAVAGFHPAVLWIDRRLDLEREAACDDFVVRRTGAARRYAACLTHAAELVYDAAEAGAAGGPALAPGAAGSTRDLAARIARLLDGRSRVRRLGRSVAAFSAGVAALAAGVALCAYAAPLVAVETPVAVSVPASPLAASVPALAAPVGAPGLDAPLSRAAARPLAERRALRPVLAPPLIGGVPGSGFEVPGAPLPALPSAPAVSEGAERGDGVPASDRARRGAGGPADPRSEGAERGDGVPALRQAQGALSSSKRASDRARRGAGVPADPGDALLAAVPFAGRVNAPAAFSLPTGGAPADAATDRGPWLAVADAGTAVGAGVKKAGVATAGFLTRLGRSIAGAF